MISDQTLWRDLEGKGVGWEQGVVSQHLTFNQSSVDMDYAAVSQAVKRFEKEMKNNRIDLKMVEKMKSELERKE